MKVVDVCAFYAPEGGGVRTYVDRKLAAAQRLGHELVVVAPGRHDDIEQRGAGARIRWIASPRLPVDRRYRYFGNRSRLMSVLDDEAPDFVEASSPWRSATFVADWGGRAPRSLVMHADPPAAYAYRWLEPVASVERVDQNLGWYWERLRILSRRFDTVISASVSLSTRLSAQGLSGVVTNPMGVEPGTFRPALRDEALRGHLLSRCMLPQDAVLLVGVGRLAPEKRWPMVVEAVAAAGCRNAMGLVLVGDGREQRRVLREVGANPHIQLIAPISDRLTLARLLASADALVHGCEAETFSMVAAEAAASGLPLIVPDRGGAADQARRYGGLLYQAGKAADLTRAVCEFVASPPKRHPVRVRSMDDHFRELFAHYEAMASERQSAEPGPGKWRRYG